MKKYRAFISYSQKDKIWARRIQKSLETYRIPLGVAVEGLTKRKLGRFFRDDDELASAASLGQALQGAIRDSESLIVIASPDAARSKWVNEEIRTFKQTHGPDRVFAVIIGGRPFASEEGAPDDECFPLALRRVVAPDGTITDVRDEPLAPDVKKDSFPRIRARLAAGLVGLDFDALWQRDRRRRIQNAGLAACGGAVAAVAIGFGLMQLSASRNETALQESRVLAEQAQGLIEARQLDDALKLIVQALPADLEKASRPFAPEALSVLTNLMAGNADLGISAQLGSAVEAMVAAPDQTVIARLQNGSFASLASGQAARIYTPKTFMSLLPSGKAQRLFSDERNTEGGWVFDQVLSEVDVATGEQVGGFRFTDPASEWSLMNGVASGDGRLVAGRGTARRPGQVAVFERPMPASTAPQAPIGILQTDIEQIGDAKLSFAGKDTLVLFSRDDTRHQLLRWTIGASSYDALAPTDADGLCPPPVSDTLAKTHAMISPEGGIISLAEPTGDRSWCLTSWHSSTGAQAHRLHIDGVSASVIQPLSRDRWLAIPGASSFGRSPQVLSADGARWELNGCDASSGLISGLSLDPPQTGVLFLGDTKIACSSGADILLHSKASPPRALSNHTADVSALSVTQNVGGAMRLWSADRSGIVRTWDLSGPGNPPEPGLSSSPIIARSAHSIAILSAAKEGGMAISVWAHDGAQRLAPTQFPVLPAIEVPGSLRQMGLRFLGRDKALITEAFLCPISFVGDAPTDCTRSTGRATVIDLLTGQPLAVVEGLAKSTRHIVPLAVAPDSVAFVDADGALQRLDLTTYERESLPPPPEGRLHEVGFVGGVLWATTAAPLPEGFKSAWRLYRQTSSGWDLALDQRQSNMSLHPAPDQGKAILLSQTLSTIQASVITGEGVTLQGEPFEKGTPLVIQPPGYEGALLLDESGAAALAADGKLQVLPALSVAAGYDFRDRAKLSNDHAAMVWLGDAKAQIFNLPDGAPLCTGLPLPNPEDAAFSPDGTRLAIKDDRAQSVVVIDLPNCAVLRRLPAEEDRPMIFADNDTLWQTAQSGAQIIATKSAPQQLLNRARQIVETLQ
ncbi:MAG: TIR domain-containing protein [Sulfitobacter sp.]